MNELALSSSLISECDMKLQGKMSSGSQNTKHKEDEEFVNFLQQIQIYIDSQDLDSLEYLLQGEDQEKLQKIKEKLTPQQTLIFDSVLTKLKNEAKENQSSPHSQTQLKVPPALFPTSPEPDESVLQTFEKQYKLTDILYAQNYSYPFLSLLQKMASIYFYRSHPNPFPESSLKMLHSLIETLFAFVFNSKIKDNYHLKKRHHKKPFNHYLKEYLFFVFNQEYQNFAAFHKLFKSIKTSLSHKEIQQSDLLHTKSKSLENAPLTSTQNFQELEYFQKISQEIKHENEFKHFNKIKCLNFLYFGEKRLKQLIDSEQKFLAENIHKETLQLLSFVLCRFVRKVILGCIRDKKAGKLARLDNDENIESVQVKIIGNALIDQYSKKVDNFMKLEEPNEQVARRTFLLQFFEFDYEKFIPKSVLQKSFQKLQKQQKSRANLPDQIWVGSKYYQSLWVQRIAGEEYIRQNTEDQHLKREKGKRNDYANFIKQNLREFDENPAGLWIKYLTSVEKNQGEDNQEILGGNGEKEEDIGKQKSRVGKRVKLQSMGE